ncbi:hypothetical protein EDEG_03611 [Edhazardia aedis USNM 41457]|uniref:Uncharacterized protein n=1 Tax=Edhazardia aedis (strain USNM 41457) TaxID=1003232 RepID=J9DKK5_EDHAE|nr:hypothetical protein EDEG_03611 [Edhazardia aedis USNM 41457]|eukprot:EJW01922.1 hypothetical protein EDEG_03611 [Edhazardia aedis USNM 41457]
MNEILQRFSQLLGISIIELETILDNIFERSDYENELINLFGYDNISDIGQIIQEYKVKKRCAAFQSDKDAELLEILRSQNLQFEKSDNSDNFCSIFKRKNKRLIGCVSESSKNARLPSGTAKPTNPEKTEDFIKKNRKDEKSKDKTSDTKNLTKKIDIYSKEKSELFKGEENDRLCKKDKKCDKYTLFAENHSSKIKSHIIDNNDYVEIKIPASNKKPEIDLLSTDLLNRSHQKYFAYTHFNPVQSVVFETAYKSEKNFLVSAPTGCGKTDIAILTILRALNKDGKIVLIVPMKALATEITAKLNQKFENTYKVLEYTGDTNSSTIELQQAKILISTPEKFDVSTRKLQNQFLVSLLIIDEIHLLDDSRGSVIETIVCRMFRDIELKQKIVRVVGLSATLPNFKDVGGFIRAEKVFHFGMEYRPVKLDMSLIGIKEREFEMFEDDYMEKISNFGKNKEFSLCDLLKATKKSGDGNLDETESEGTQDDCEEGEIWDKNISNRKGIKKKTSKNCQERAEKKFITEANENFCDAWCVDDREIVQFPQNTHKKCIVLDASEIDRKMSQKIEASKSNELTVVKNLHQNKDFRDKKINHGLEKKHVNKPKGKNAIESKEHGRYERKSYGRYRKYDKNTLTVFSNPKPRSQKQIFNERLNAILLEKLESLFAQNNQCLIFVTSRRETSSFAKYLLSKFPTKSFGIHHAGLPRAERLKSEESFKDGKINALVTTSTLAWGVNLPARCVIIKNTEFYSNETGCFTDMSILDVLQIFGRAGRPQFDSIGEAVLITQCQKLQKYFQALKQNRFIESKLLVHVVDILNAEIYLGTITCLSDALMWIKSTFLFVRMVKAPILYGFSKEEIEKGQIDKVLTEYIMLGVKRLAEYKLIEIKFRKTEETNGKDKKNQDILYNNVGSSIFAVDDYKSEFLDNDIASYHQTDTQTSHIPWLNKELLVFESTPVGRIASHYYLLHETVNLWLFKMDFVYDEESLIEMLFDSNEFSQLFVRDAEIPVLNMLITDLNLRKTLKNLSSNNGACSDLLTAKDKMKILWYAYKENNALQNFSLLCDQKFIIENLERIVLALMEFLLFFEKLELYEIACKVDKFISKIDRSSETETEFTSLGEYTFVESLNYYQNIYVLRTVRKKIKPNKNSIYNKSQISTVNNTGINLSEKIVADKNFENKELGLKSENKDSEYYFDDVKTLIGVKKNLYLFVKLQEGDKMHSENMNFTEKKLSHIEKFTQFGVHVCDEINWTYSSHKSSCSHFNILYKNDIFEKVPSINEKDYNLSSNFEKMKVNQKINNDFTDYNMTFNVSSSLHYEENANEAVDLHLKKSILQKKEKILTDDILLMKKYPDIFININDDLSPNHYNIYLTIHPKVKFIEIDDVFHSERLKLMTRKILELIGKTNLLIITHSNEDMETTKNDLNTILSLKEYFFELERVKHGKIRKFTGELVTTYDVAMEQLDIIGDCTVVLKGMHGTYFNNLVDIVKIIGNRPCIIYETKSTIKYYEHVLNV